MIIFKIRKEEIRKLFSITLLSIESILPFSLFQYRHKRNNLQLQSIFSKTLQNPLYYLLYSFSIYPLQDQTFPKIFVFSKNNIFSLLDIVTKEITSISTRYKDNPIALHDITISTETFLSSDQMIIFPKKRSKH